MTDGQPFPGMSEDRRGLAKSSTGIAFLAALGVLSGFLVDAAMAALFGASARTDAFFIAATIPFAVASVLLASTNQTLVPLIYTWFSEGTEDEALGKVGRLLGTAVAAAFVVALVGTALAPLIPHALAPGSTSGTKSAAVGMTALLFGTVVTRVGAEILRALLNARFSFLVPAAMAIVENLTALAVTLALADALGVAAVAAGYVAGGFLQLGYMAVVTYRRGLRIRPQVRLRDPDVRRAFRLMRLPLAGTGTNLVARAIERLLASFLTPGSITILNYAWVVVNSMGGAIFFRSVVVALLPRLTQAREDGAVSRRILGDGIRLMMLISLPLTALLIVLAPPLVAFAFQRGAFTAESAALLASILAIYALQFPLDATVRVFLSYSYARLDTRTPFVNVVIGVALDMAFALVLFQFLGVRGIALAYVLASIGNLIHAHRSVTTQVQFSVRPLGRLLGKIVAASVVAGAAAAGVLWLLPAESSFLGRAMRLGLPGLAGLLACTLSLLALGLRPSRLRAPEGPFAGGAPPVTR